MRWNPKIQVSGTGLALVSAIAPTLQIEIPYALRIAGFLIGLLMVVWPASFYVFGLIRGAGKMLLIIGMSAGAVLFLGCAVALYLGPTNGENRPKILNASAVDSIRLFAQCDLVQPTIIVPIDGRIYLLQLNAIPASAGGGG